MSITPRYCYGCGLTPVAQRGTLCSACERGETMDHLETKSETICEGCAEEAALPGEWYCAECLALLHDVGEVEEVCSSCRATPATVFGICDQCYDDAYMTRTAGRHYSKAWNWNPPAETPVPEFADECQRLPTRRQKVPA